MLFQIKCNSSRVARMHAQNGAAANCSLDDSQHYVRSPKCVPNTEEKRRLPRFCSLGMPHSLLRPELLSPADTYVIVSQKHSWASFIPTAGFAVDHNHKVRQPSTDCHVLAVDHKY